MSGLFVETLYGYTTRQGLVEVTLTNEKHRSVTAQCTPDEARAMAHNLLDGASIAETEEILMQWLQDSVGIDDIGRRVQILAEFRTYRDKKGVHEVI